MARVLTNNVALSYTIESALGVAGTVWYQMEPNTIGTFGAVVTTVARNPISADRQRRKGTTTDLDSSVEIEHDWTMEAFQDFIEGFVFATGYNAENDILVSAVDTTLDVFTVPALTASQANNLEWSTLQYGTLIFARGFAETANNGLHQVDADIATSAVAVSVATNLTTEASPPANARIELAGLRLLDALVDLSFAYSAGIVTVTSAADIPDWSTFLEIGQFVHFGSATSAGVVQNAFQNAVANDQYGYARVRTIAAGVMTLDKVSAALQNNAPTIPATVDILFGKFMRNVATNHANYVERSFQFEAEFPDLASVGNPEYQYAIGNLCNSVSFNLPLTDKATVTFGFIGTDTENPVVAGSRKTGASTAIVPLQTVALNTSADIARLRVTEVDETGLSTDFKSLTVTLNNNVSPEKVLGQLGAAFMNAGNLEVNVEAQLIFTNGDVVDRIRANTTVTMDFVVENDDGAIMVDVPSMTIGGGAREFPVNESVLINLAGEAFKDTLFTTSVSFSTFPAVPAISAG